MIFSVFLETNLDQYDIVEVKGYTFYGKFRNTISSRKSGGIGIYIKDELYSFIDILDNTYMRLHCMV